MDIDSKEILKFCLEKGILIDKDVLSLFSEPADSETAKLILDKVGQQTKTKIITGALFKENKEKINQILLTLPNENQKIIEKLKIQLGLSIQISKEISVQAEQEPEIIQKSSFLQEIEGVKIISSYPALVKKLEVGDFTKYFKRRFVEMRNILQDRSELTNLVSIDKISGNRQGISIIGMVSSKRLTKNKNLLLEMEDLTGKILVIVNQNKPELFKKAEDAPLDGVLGIKCSSINKEMVFVNDIFFPETILLERKKSPVEEYSLFTGDLHVGGKNFMEANFLKFIDYLNGKLPNTPEVQKIKYLFLVGDLIAGVGIYPEQEKDLVLSDVESQYGRVAELLDKIRKDIKIIISPGNHDALRIMEPQPLLDEKYAWPIYELKNVILTGNPSYVNIAKKENFSGFNVLTYHGYSFHYYANNINSLVKEKAIHKPELLMAYLLKNRHLAPTHASTLYFPSETDPFLIRTAPDIFFSGHTHKSAVSYYNNILTISSSCWESKTAFQEKMGNEPDFCKVPMLNLKTGAIKILDFE
ncbi:MAG: metallophosphoesterase [Nanoarchaeota archaeon]|nr:metallophosphoesterase [Nanoarchaeota archaeon]